MYAKEFQKVHIEYKIKNVFMSITAYFFSIAPSKLFDFLCVPYLLFLFNFERFVFNLCDKTILFHTNESNNKYHSDKV